LKVIVVFTSDYGKRFLDHFKKTAPDSWEIIGYQFTGALPTVIDDPEEVLPTDLPQGDLLVYLGEDRKLAEIIPEMAEACKVKEVIAPVDARGHLPTGLANQILRQLKKKQVPIIFPAPFCSLAEADHQGPLTQAFAKRYGKPDLELSIMDGRIRSATVLRGSPCGNTHFVAEHLTGLKVDDNVLELTGKFFHAHPCQGSMDMDRELGDTILHVAGNIIKDTVKSELEKKGFVD